MSASKHFLETATVSDLIENAKRYCARCDHHKDYHAKDGCFCASTDPTGGCKCTTAKFLPGVFMRGGIVIERPKRSRY